MNSNKKEEKLVVLRAKEFDIEVIKDGHLRGDFTTYINIDDLSIPINSDVCEFDIYTDSITPYSNDKFTGFAIYNRDWYPGETIPFSSYGNKGEKTLTTQYETTLTIVEVNTELPNKVKLKGRYIVSRSTMSEYMCDFTYDKKTKAFTVGDKTFTISNLENDITENLNIIERYIISVSDMCRLMVDKKSKEIILEGYDTGTIIPSSRKFYFDISVDKVVGYKSEEFNGFAILQHTDRHDSKKSYKHFKLRIMKVDTKEPGGMWFVDDYRVADYITNDKIENFTYIEKTGMFTINNYSRTLDDLYNCTKYFDSSSSGNEYYIADSVKNRIPVLETEKYVLTSSLDTHLQTMYVVINGKSTAISGPVDYDPCYCLFIECNNKLLDKFNGNGFAIYNYYANRIDMFEVDIETGMTMQSGEYKLDINQSSLTSFSYDEKTEMFTIGDEKFRFKDMFYSFNEVIKPVIKDYTVVSKELARNMICCLVTDHITDKYTIREYEHDRHISVVIPNTIARINLDVCCTNSSSDKVILYKTKDFDGFAIFHNEYTPFLTIVKVNPELDGTVEVMGRYHLNKYVTDRYTEIFTYDTVEEIFTVDDGNFKIEDLEVYKGNHIIE